MRVKLGKSSNATKENVQSGIGDITTHISNLPYDRLSPENYERFTLDGKPFFLELNKSKKQLRNKKAGAGNGTIKSIKSAVHSRSKNNRSHKFSQNIFEKKRKTVKNEGNANPNFIPNQAQILDYLS